MEAVGKEDFFLGGGLESCAEDSQNDDDDDEEAWKDIENKSEEDCCKSCEGKS